MKDELRKKNEALIAKRAKVKEEAQSFANEFKDVALRAMLYLRTSPNAYLNSIVSGLKRTHLGREIEKDFRDILKATAAKGKVKPVPVEVKEVPAENKEKSNQLTLKELRQIAKERGIKGVSRLSREELEKLLK